MTTTSKANPPSKTVQGLPSGTLRTTMTHVEIDDMVLVQTGVGALGECWVPAPAKPTKRAVWGKVYACGPSIRVGVEGHAEAIVLDYVAHTAITIRDRELCIDCGEDHGDDYTCPAETMDHGAVESMAKAVPVAEMTLAEAEVIVSAEPTWGAADAARVTAEDMAGLPTPVEAAAAYAAGRPWSARGSKRKASSKSTKRRRVLAGVR